MTDLVADILTVWTPWTVLAAILSGLIIGIGLSWPISNPLWSSRVATRGQVSVFVAVMSAWIVTVLYVASILAAAASRTRGRPDRRCSKMRFARPAMRRTTCVW